ncbi:MAG: FtsL-like putative cell division protein [Bacteroidota bacterium]|nr:FtsL-like putative cell division protein [Bacteroidota bacterium]MEC9209486.1 FtsL-like putative cell division protein [Bacteroidota bacterium]
MTNKKDSSNTLSSILKGEFIAERSNKKLIPFLLMIVVLGLINIRSSFHAEKLLKQSISLEKEVAVLRLTHITTKSELMSVYRRSVVEGLVKSQGLKTSLTPPEIIEK